MRKQEVQRGAKRNRSEHNDSPEETKTMIKLKPDRAGVVYPSYHFKMDNVCTVRSGTT